MSNGRSAGQAERATRAAPRPTRRGGRQGRMVDDRWGRPRAAALGGSDAPREMLEDDPQLTSSVLGETTGSEEPATSEGHRTRPAETAPTR